MKATDDQLESVLEAVAGYFGALAEPTRLRVLRAICPGELTVGSIVEETGVSQPAVSADTSTPELCRTVCARIRDRMVGRPQLRQRLKTAFAQGR